MEQEKSAVKDDFWGFVAVVIGMSIHLSNSNRREHADSSTDEAQ
jgi:hypothetical protein